MYARSVGANGALSQIGTADIQVTGGGTLSGMVLDDADFTPVAGATVTIEQRFHPFDRVAHP